MPDVEIWERYHGKKTYTADSVEFVGNWVLLFWGEKRIRAIPADRLVEVNVK